MTPMLPVLRRRFFLATLICAGAVAAHSQMPLLPPLPKTGSLSTPSNPQQFTFLVAADNRPAKPLTVKDLFQKRYLPLRKSSPLPL